MLEQSKDNTSLPVQQHRPMTFELDKNNSQLNALMAMLANRYCAYYPVLTRVCGNNPKASLMLSHSLQLTKIMIKNQPDRDGWFWKTAKEWEAEIGLSQKEIESSRKALRDIGILQEELRGIPARCWFKIDLDRLAEVICMWANKQTQPWEWGNKELFALLGRPSIYYQAIARITNNAIAAIYLSHAISRYTQMDNDERTALNGWFSISISDAERKLAIGKKSLYDARIALEQAHLIKQMREKREDPRLLIKLNFGLMIKHINSVYEAEKNSRQKLPKLPENPDSMRTFQNGETRTFQNGETGTFQNGETRKFQNGETSFAVLEPQKEGLYNKYNNNYINTNINTPPTPPTQNETDIYQVEEGVNKSFSDDKKTNYPTVTPCNSYQHTGNDLVWPKKAMLLPEERQEIISILNAVALDKAQLILDEVEGRMKAGIKINLMISYVRKLTRLTLENSFFPDYAHKVQAERLKAMQLEAVKRAEAEAKAAPREANTNGDGYQSWQRFRSDNWRMRK